MGWRALGTVFGCVDGSQLVDEVQCSPFWSQKVFRSENPVTIYDEALYTGASPENHPWYLYFLIPNAFENGAR